MKLKIVFSSVIALIGGLLAQKSLAASSTVLVDPPDIADAIAKIYQTAQPLLNSIIDWVWIIVGVLVVFAIIGLILRGFNR